MRQGGHHVGHWPTFLVYNFNFNYIGFMRQLIMVALRNFHPVVSSFFFIFFFFLFFFA